MANIYIPAREIDDAFVNFGQQENPQEKEEEEESKCQIEAYSSNNKIMDMNSLFKYIGELVQFDFIQLLHLYKYGSNCISNNFLKQSNMNMLKEAFLTRMKQEITGNENKTEDNIFQFLIKRSSDNPVLYSMGQSLFNTYVGAGDDMKKLFESVFGNGKKERNNLPDFFDCELAGKITIEENTAQKLIFKCNMSHFRERLYLKDCMQLVKSVIVFSFLFDIIMFVLFSLSGKTLEYKYYLDLYCEENLSSITGLKGILNHAQKCSFYISLHSVALLAKK